MAKTILVIDDDRLVRRSLDQYLTEGGFSVTQAVNGKEGLDAALETHPDLIVTDIRMPEMDGMEFLEQLRKDDWGRTARVIVMSSDDSTTTVNKALEVGVTFYLSKANLTPDLIAQQVSMALS